MCVCICVYVFLSICVCVCMCVCMYMYVSMYMCVCVYEYMRMCLYVYVYVYMCICVYVSLCVCVFENRIHKILWNFEIQTDHPNPSQKKKNKKKWGFAVPTDHRVKIKENQKKRQILGPWRRKQGTMSVTVIQILIDTLGMVSKRVQGLKIGGWIETIQITALQRPARIPRRVLETLEDLLSFRP